MTPDFQPDVPLLEILLYSILNPATIVVAFMMGRAADQRGKILIAAFAGAMAGIALLYVAAWFRIWEAPTLGRAAAGVFATSIIAGLVYAGAGYATKR